MSLQPVSTLTSYSGETFRTFLAEQLKSARHRYVLKAIEVITKYLLVVLLTNVRADTLARELTSIFFRKTYLSEKILSNLGTSSNSELLHELTTSLEIQFDHASWKHPWTVGAVECSNSALKRNMKLSTNDQWNNWLNYVQLATFIHKTPYHSAIGWSHTVLFNGCEPMKPLDPGVNNTQIEQFSPNSQ